MIVILTIPQSVLYTLSLDIMVDDIVSFIYKYIEIFIGISFIILLIIVRVVKLNKMVKYQNQSIQALGNSYVAIFRVNLNTDKLCRRE